MRARVLAFAAAGPLVAGYAAVAALLALVTAISSGATFSTAGALFGAVPGWLAAYHVPLTLSGGELGVLPLLPTALVMLLVAQVSSAAADRLDLVEPADARQVVLTVTAAHATFGAALAALLPAGPVAASPVVAFFGCGAVAGVAATLGVSRRCGLAEVLLGRLDGVARRGLRFGVMGLAALVGCAAGLLLLGMVRSSAAMSDLFARVGPEPGNGVGMLLLCVGYLPNAVVGALSYLLGPGFSIGSVVASPLHVVGGALPDVPLLAALPRQHSASSALVLALPAAVGGLVGWRCRRLARGPLARCRAVAIAAAVVAAGTFMLAAVTGGRLGAGPFDPVSLPAGLLALVAFGWVGVPGGLVTVLAGPRSRRRARATRHREPAAPEELVLDESAVEDALAAADRAGAESSATDDAAERAASQPEPDAEPNAGPDAGPDAGSGADVAVEADGGEEANRPG